MSSTSPPYYKLLVDEDDPHTRKRRSIKSTLVRVLGVLAIMYAAFAGLRALSRTKFAGRIWESCGGGPMHRNMSMEAGAKLPSHYVLPSGDRIPAVALGTVQYFECYHSSEAGLMQEFGRLGRAKSVLPSKYVCLSVVLS